VLKIKSEHPWKNTKASRANLPEIIAANSKFRFTDNTDEFIKYYARVSVSIPK
jgi:hypothetical protein